MLGTTAWAAPSSSTTLDDKEELDDVDGSVDVEAVIFGMEDKDDGETDEAVANGETAELEAGLAQAGLPAGGVQGPLPDTSKRTSLELVSSVQMGSNNGKLSGRTVADGLGFFMIIGFTAQDGFERAKRAESSKFSFTSAILAILKDSPLRITDIPEPPLLALLLSLLPLMQGLCQLVVSTELLEMLSPLPSKQLFILRVVLPGATDTLVPIFSSFAFNPERLMLVPLLAEVSCFTSGGKFDS